MERVLLVFTLVAMNMMMKAQVAIDLHSHFTTPAYLQVLAKHDASMEEGFPIPAWSACTTTWLVPLRLRSSR